MSHIAVNDEQAALIAASNGTVQVRDTRGRVIGYLTPWPSAEEIAEAKARLAAGPGGPTYTTVEMLEYLRSLDQR
jgi:hypothetical protein